MAEGISEICELSTHRIYCMIRLTMELVTVTDGTRSYDFMLTDGVLLLEDIQPFFEKACALLYLLNERKLTVSCRNGAFKIPDTVSSLEVICGQNASPTATKRTFDNAILSVIDKHKSKMHKISRKKEGRVVTIKKEIHLGWRHLKKNKYFAMNEATCNEKVLYIDENTEYSYEDILQQCIDKLSDARNVNFFKHSTALLGTFKEDIFSKFTDEQRNHYSLCVYTKPIENPELVNIDRNLNVKSPQKQPVRTVLGKIKENNHAPEQSSKETAIMMKKMGSEPWRDHRAAQLILLLHLCWNNLKDLEISTPIIKKEEITFTSKLLGQGSFVKTLRLGMNYKKICLEIAVMDKIRHSNVIIIMAVAYDISHCYIVMKLFDSISLREFNSIQVSRTIFK
ncbi:hypothetical protein TSAR_012811 [Trichomalopsis sarcophagae]|uniref:Uncharacterized protein n=1 Tax=Trichomalopsis sarcophagae TaxID=543379 RepID=A0A232F3A3_9HYME|nr:hypothetical protein TSAR_012811 [Trichomalopsis sarcophagae]